MKSSKQKFISLLCLSVLAASNTCLLPVYAKDDVLLPPIAPKLDTRASTDAPSGRYTAPSYNSASSDASNGQSQDATKTALQQATMLYQQGRTDEAENAFKKVLKLDSRNADAYFNLGVIAESKNDFVNAQKNYARASQLNPSDSDFADAVRSIQSRISDQNALANRNRDQQKQAAQMVQSDRDNDQLKAMVADSQAAFKAGNFSKAVSGLQTVASRAPNDPDVQYALAQAYRGAGNINGARAALNKAISLDPQNQLYLVALNELNQSSLSSAPTTDQYNHNQNQGGQSGYGQIPYQPYNSSQSSYGGGSSTVGYQSVPYNGNFSSPNGGVQPFTSAGESQLTQSRNYQNGFAYSGYGYGGGITSSSRMKRAAIGAAGGAAVGMMFGGRYNRGRSMMSGAMIGGMLGLMSGGMHF